MPYPPSPKFVQNTRLRILTQSTTPRNFIIPGSKQLQVTSAVMQTICRHCGHALAGKPQHLHFALELREELRVIVRTGYFHAVAQRSGHVGFVRDMRFGLLFIFVHNKHFLFPEWCSYLCTQYSMMCSLSYKF